MKPLPFSAGSIVYPAIFEFCAHQRMLVRQAKRNSRTPDSQWLIRIQRIEPDARPFMFVPDVRPEIQFEKVRDQRKPRQSVRANSLHEKSHDTDPCFSFK